MDMDVPTFVDARLRVSRLSWRKELAGAGFAVDSPGAARERVPGRLSVLILVLRSAALPNPFVNNCFLESQIATQLEVWDSALMDKPVNGAQVAV
jgi:hypothetical protein